MSERKISYSIDKIDSVLRFTLAYEGMLVRFGLTEDETYKKYFELSQKIECLKKEYSKYFIDELQHHIRYDGISIDRILEVLPSKSFIDFSKERERKLETEQHEYFWYRSAEDLVLRRLCSREVEEGYQKAKLDKRIILGYSEWGQTVYTSFTKGEYEEDFKECKKLIRKK